MEHQIRSYVSELPPFGMDEMIGIPMREQLKQQIIAKKLKCPILAVKTLLSIESFFIEKEADFSASFYLKNILEIEYCFLGVHA